MPLFANFFKIVEILSITYQACYFGFMPCGFKQIQNAWHEITSITLRFYTLGFKRLQNTVHGVTSKFYWFHALGFKQIQNAEHEIASILRWGFKNLENHNSEFVFKSSINSELSNFKSIFCFLNHALVCNFDYCF